MPDIPSFPWWYLAKQSAIMNNLCLVLGGHLNNQMVSPLTAIKRDEITIEVLAAADQFLKSCLSAIIDPGRVDHETRYDLFMAVKVLYNCQKELEIRLDENDEEGFKKKLEQYRRILEKIINYNPDADQLFSEENVLHLIKFFNALANSIHISISAHHRLLMTQGRTR